MNSPEAETASGERRAHNDLHRACAEELMPGDGRTGEIGDVIYGGEMEGTMLRCRREDLAGCAKHQSEVGRCRALRRARSGAIPEQALDHEPVGEEPAGTRSPEAEEDCTMESRSPSSTSRSMPGCLW